LEGSLSEINPAALEDAIFPPSATGFMKYGDWRAQAEAVQVSRVILASVFCHFFVFIFGWAHKKPLASGAGTCEGRRQK
jgi:hypothetical protein